MLKRGDFDAAAESGAEICGERFDESFVSVLKVCRVGRCFGASGLDFAARSMPRMTLPVVRSASWSWGNAARRLSFSGSPA